MCVQKKNNYATMITNVQFMFTALTCTYLLLL